MKIKQSYFERLCNNIFKKKLSASNSTSTSKNNEEISFQMQSLVKEIQTLMTIIYQTTTPAKFDSAIIMVRRKLDFLIPYDNQIRIGSYKPSQLLTILNKKEDILRTWMQERIEQKSSKTYPTPTQAKSQTPVSSPTKPTTQPSTFSPIKPHMHLNPPTQANTSAIHPTLPNTQTSCPPPASSTSLPRNIDTMSGPEFENICIEILQKNGYKNVHGTMENATSGTGGSGDQGIDILAEGNNGVLYGIQCKRYRQAVGNDAVQQAFAGKTYYNVMVAVVMTNSHFTTAAKNLAKKNGVVLWDRKILGKMLKNANIC